MTLGDDGQRSQPDGTLSVGVGASGAAGAQPARRSALLAKLGQVALKRDAQMGPVQRRRSAWRTANDRSRRDGFAEVQPVQHVADIQHALHGRRTLDQREATAGAAREAVLPEDEPHCAGVDEGELAQVQHDVLEARAAQLVELRLKCGGVREVEFTAGRDAHCIALRMNVDAKRRRVVLRAGDAVSDGGRLPSDNDEL